VTPAFESAAFVTAYHPVTNSQVRIAVLDTGPEDLCERIAARPRTEPQDARRDEWLLLVVTDAKATWSELVHEDGLATRDYVAEGTIHHEVVDDVYRGRAKLRFLDEEWQPAGTLSVRFEAPRCDALADWYFGAS
jgi:hypothetical protein